MLDYLKEHDSASQKEYVFLTDFGRELLGRVEQEFGGLRKPSLQELRKKKEIVS